MSEAEHSAQPLVVLAEVTLHDKEGTGIPRKEFHDVGVKAYIVEGHLFRVRIDETVGVYREWGQEVHGQKTVVSENEKLGSAFDMALRMAADAEMAARVVGTALWVAANHLVVFNVPNNGMP